jgi:hypothetical protein
VTTSIQEALLKALDTRTDSRKLLEVHDYWQDEVEFIAREKEIEPGLVMVSAYEWFQMMIDCLPKNLLEKVEHYHGGGNVFLKRGDADKIVAWKNSNGAKTQVTEVKPTTTKGIVKYDVLALYKIF